MSQRSFFWPSHENPHSDSIREADGADSKSLQDNRRRSSDTLHARDQSAGRTYATLQYPHTRLPSNTGAPIAAVQPSLHSSHSSSPSPTPSLNPYGGSLRSMLHTGSNPAPQSPTRTSFESGVRSRTSAPAPAPANALPANIRRVASGQTRNRQKPPLGPRQETVGTPADVTHSLPQYSAHTGNAGRDARCEQIVQNFYSKTAQVIAHLRGYGAAGFRLGSGEIESTSATLPPRGIGASTGPSGSSLMCASSASSSAADLGSGGRRINRWFNLELEDIAAVKEEARFWRHAVGSSQLYLRRPPPMYIEVCLDVSGVLASDELQVTDIYGRPWTVDLDIGASDSDPVRSPQSRSRQRASTIVLEVWRLSLDVDASATPTLDLPRVYKRAIVFFRSLYAFANLLPCVALARQLAAAPNGLALLCSLRPEVSARDGVIDLDVSLTGTECFLESHDFEHVPTPMGTFSMGVQYRRECLFSSTAPHSLLPHESLAAFGAADDTYFTPTLSSRSGSNFSLHPSRNTNQPLSVTSPQSVQPASLWSDAATLQRTSTAAAAIVRNHHLPLQGSSLGNDRSLAMPSVNPFRARPLSIGASSSLPSRIDTDIHRRSSVRRSSEWHTSNNMTLHNAGAIYSIRSHTIAAGSSAGSAQPLHGHGSTHTDAHSSRGRSSSSAHAHSYDHRPIRLGSSGSGTVAIADSASTLHRNVMLRRLGGSLSPTEPHRQLELFGRVAGGAPESYTSDSRSPPKPSIASIPSISSGSAGSIAVGRSGLGIAPFKSPSLSESPALGIGAFADISTLAGMSENETGNGSLPRTSEDMARRRGYTVAQDTALHAPSILSGPEHPSAKLSESPSSISTVNSSHSRRLSSSFGNRRSSMVRRHPSVLGTSATDRPSAATAAAPYESAGMSRRHTIIEGQVWSASTQAQQQERRGHDGCIETVGPNQDLQDIGDFIRMLDAKQPLRVYSHKSSPTRRPHLRENAQSRAGQDQTTELSSVPPLQHSSPTSAAPRRHRKSAPPGHSCGSADETSRVLGSGPLRKYQGILDEFSGISRDMEKSVISRGRALDSTPEDVGTGSMADGGDISGSPFRRVAMPNPLRSSGSRPSGSRPPSIALATTSTEELPPSMAEPLESSGNVDLLRQAFDGLSIETEDKVSEVLAASTHLPLLSTGNRAHIRSAAPGLDLEREHPLPRPVTIPHTNPEYARPRQQARQALRADAGTEEKDATEARRPNVPRMRGKSQPVTHIPELIPGIAPRMTTPQPLSFHQHGLLQGGYAQQNQPHFPPQPRMGRAPSMRTSPEARPFSYRSDLTATGSGQLGALLSAADDGLGRPMKAPRSTPSTPSQTALTVHPRANGAAASRERRATGPRYDTGDRLRSNFPPLSFIIPRSRVEREEQQLQPVGREQHSQSQNTSSYTAEVADEDDEDLIFQMDASIH
ncbi:autophagy protein 13 [Coemansia sp. RSA 1365]|nr:autophagy protein 13 [Coemansia sp. RSA 1365]